MLISLFTLCLSLFALAVAISVMVRQKKDRETRDNPMGPAPAGMTRATMLQELKASQPSQFGCHWTVPEWKAWVASIAEFPHALTSFGPRDLIEAAIVRNAPVGLLEHWEKQGFDLRARAFALDRLLIESARPSLELMAFLLGREASPDGNPVPGWTYLSSLNEPGNPVPYRLLLLAQRLGHAEPVLALLREHGASDEPLVQARDADVLLWEWYLENEWPLTGLLRLVDAGVSPTKGLPFALEMFNVFAVDALLSRGADPFEKVEDETSVGTAGLWCSDETVRLLFEHIYQARRKEALDLLLAIEDVEPGIEDLVFAWIETLRKGRSAIEEEALWEESRSTKGLDRLQRMAEKRNAFSAAEVLIRSLACEDEETVRTVFKKSDFPWLASQVWLAGQARTKAVSSVKMF